MVQYQPPRQRGEPNKGARWLNVTKVILGILVSILGIILFAWQAPKASTEFKEFVCEDTNGWRGWAATLRLDCTTVVTRIPPERGRAVPLPVSADPAASAREQIRAADYSLDNAGYMKALAQGSEVSGLFRHLRIFGDDASLRRALLAYPVGSTEFDQLSLFLVQAHSEHYASKIREEIKTYIRSAQTSNSIEILRRSACSTVDRTFIDNFVRRSLPAACHDEAAWRASALQFAKEITGRIDMNNFSWWVEKALQLETSRTAAAQPIVAKEPSGAPRTISGADLIAWLYDHSKADFVQADVNILLYNNLMPGKTHFAIVDRPWEEYLNSPTNPHEIDNEKYRKHECVVVGNRAPKCMARVRFFRMKANDLVRAVGIENVRKTGGFYPECKFMSLYYKC